MVDRSASGRYTRWVVSWEHLKLRDFSGIRAPLPGSALAATLISCCVLCACSTEGSGSGATPPPPEGIDLQGVSAWHHVGTELRASVTAKTASFPEGLATTELREARIHLASSALTFRAARATIDLETLEGHGEGEVVLEGVGWTATGGRFHVAASGQELEISDPVRVETPAS